MSEAIGSTVAGINPNPRNQQDNIMNWNRLCTWLATVGGGLEINANGGLAVTLATITLAVPNNLLVNGAPSASLSTTGTFTLTNATQSIHTFFAAGATASGLAPTFRLIADTDLAASPGEGKVLASHTTATMTWMGLVTGEAPTGTIDGVNGTFTLTHAPLVNTSAVYVAGLRANPTGDFLITGSTLVLTAPPAGGVVLLADYRY